MKSTELRRGNYVTTEDRIEKDEYLLVDALWGDTIYCLSTEGGLPSSNNWQLIPLNETWLKRLGFKLMEKDMGIYQLLIDKKHIAPGSKGAYDIVALLTDGVAKANCCVNGWWSTRSMQYVHEIQNAYYFITGEELTAPAGDAGEHL